MADHQPQESITFGGRTFTPERFRQLMLAAGVNPFLLAEAVASTQMSHDEAAQTYTVEGLDAPRRADPAP